MRIIIVGGSGTIGKKLSEEFSKRHEVIIAGRNSGSLHVDITSPESIEKFYQQAGPFDALVSAAGGGHVGPLKTMTDTDFRKGVDSKLMGQINLVLIGQRYINPKGSFTLTSGILSEDPIAAGANLSSVNSAVNGFVLSAAMELENSVRINVVSPGVVEDSPQLFPFFPGHTPVSMKQVVRGYIKSVEGAVNGQIIKAH
jgi:NAD(P)-dependent dehydrogenase (short-subunit alcohol dehydrogenase family)